MTTSQAEAAGETVFDPHGEGEKTILGNSHTQAKGVVSMSEFNWTPDELQKIVEENSVVLFMKGTPEAPQCGFSNRAASVVSQLGVPFASVNVLSDARARNALRDWSGFPTMPQLFIGGKLIGGSDIALELFQSGELQTLVNDATDND